jgi:hypothetical protein
MARRKFARGLGGIVRIPFRLAPRSIVYQPHDTVGRDDV